MSTEFDANASAWEFLTGLENMPNIGTVSVEEVGNSSTDSSGRDTNTSVWQIVFTSAVGEFPSLEVRMKRVLRLNVSEIPVLRSSVS